MPRREDAAPIPSTAARRHGSGSGARADATSACAHLSGDAGHLADAILNKNDPQALAAATQEAMTCMSLDPSQPGSLQMAQQAARCSSRSVTCKQANMTLTYRSRC